MIETLEPCPFCGSEAEMITAESMNGGYLFGIMCNDCLSRGDVYDTEAEAIAAWNARAERMCHLIHTGQGCWECDSCGGSIDWDSCDPNDPPACNYCPNCGAKVVEE